MARKYGWQKVITGVFIVASALVFLPSHQPSHELHAQEPVVSSLHPKVTFTFTNNARTVPDAFTQAGLEYHPEDKISLYPSPSLGLGGVAVDEQALPVSLIDGKKKMTYRTWGGTVGELLAEKHIELGAEDKISPVLSTTLTTNMTVTIVRVARTTVTETEPVAFQTIQQNDDTIYYPQVVTAQEGKNGVREKKYLLIRQDGELVSKTLTSDKVTQPAVNKVVKVGTKLKIGRVINGGSMTYYQNQYGTKVAMDAFPRGTRVRVTNPATGKSIIVNVDGCICDNSSTLIDLNPSYFQQLGATLSQGRVYGIKVEEVLN